MKQETKKDKAGVSWQPMGCGLGLRTQHYPAIIDQWPKVDWFEAISENYMNSGGRPLHVLEQVRAHYPAALHGIALSIGSVDPLNQNYLQALKKLIRRIDPFIVSDHLCWSGVNGEQLHDLLPLPFTEEAIQHVVRRVEYVQEFLGRRILLENASTYVTYQYSVMPEWEFITEIASRAGCGILLDLNNIYVNAVNHKFNPYDYLKNVPGELVGQFHLAGHTNMGDFLFDTHSSPVIDKVWDLYREALRLWGPVSTLIEWDAEIPTFERLCEEAERAKKIYREFSSGAEGFAGSSSRSPLISPLAKSKDECLRQAPAAGAGELPVLKANPSTPILLSESQKWMKERIQPGHHAKSFPKLLNPQGKATGDERMSVYANGYTARIHESLVEVFEAVHTVLGDNSFLDLCHAYAERYPSHEYNLNLVGRHVAEFLENSKWTKQAPFLADLARLEWLIWNAFHAFDEVPFTPEQAAKIPADEWENIRVIFQPSVSLLSSSRPVLDIWRARREKPEEVKIELRSRPQYILIGRKADQVRCELLDEHQFTLIAGLLNGKSLGEVCGELAETLEEAELPITAWFSNWVRDGLILCCRLRRLPSTTTARRVGQPNGWDCRLTTTASL